MGDSQYGELIQDVCQHFYLINEIANKPQNLTVLSESVQSSRATIDRMCTAFERASIIREATDGYVLTGAGKLLVESFQTQLAEPLTPEEIELVENRHDLLTTLQSEPLHKRDLVDRTDNSRSTVDRAIDKLEETGLVARRSHKWEPTDRGETVSNCYRVFVAEAETILDARTLLEAVPADAPIPLGVLSDNEVHPGADQYQLINHLGGRIQTTDRYRVILPRIEDSRHIRLYHSLVTRTDATMELLAPADVLVHLSEEFPYLSTELARAEGFQAYECDRPPFGVLLMSHTDEPSSNTTGEPPTATTDQTAASIDADQTTSATIVVYGDHGIRGFIDLTTDETRAWARAVADRIDAESQLATDKLETATTDTEFPPLTGDRLPVQIRTAGFVRLDDEYFHQRAPLSPATAWCTGLSFPEIDAGYAVARSSQTHQSMTQQLFEKLTAGEDLALLGPPGSGKSTVCKRVAHRWYDRDQGTVLYREGQSGEAFESAGQLEAAIDRISEPVLVVVEDAVRADAHHIFEVMRTYSGQDDVQFLLDAREAEWHDTDTLPTDARLVAFRNEHLETVHMSALDERDCQRLIERVESITDSSISVSGAELQR